MAPAPSKVSDGRAYALLALAAACWAGNHVVGRWTAIEQPSVPPGGLSFLRWLLAFVVVLPFAWPHLKADWPAVRARPLAITLLGLGGGAGFSIIQYYALYYTIAVNVGVMNSTGPAFIILAGLLIFRDRVSALQLAGIAVSLCGVLVILTRGDIGRIAALGFNFGDLLAVGNMLVFAVYSACLRMAPRIHLLTFVALLSLLACLGSLPVAIIETVLGHPLRATLPTATAVVYTGLFTSVAAYFSWSAGVTALGPARAGAFLHLVPLFSATMSMLFLGEHPRLFHAVGLGLIIAGVTLAARRQRSD